MFSYMPNAFVALHLRCGALCSARRRHGGGDGAVVQGHAGLHPRLLAKRRAEIRLGRRPHEEPATPVDLPEQQREAPRLVPPKARARAELTITSHAIASHAFTCDLIDRITGDRITRDRINRNTYKRPHSSSKAGPQPRGRGAQERWEQRWPYGGSDARRSAGAGRRDTDIKAGAEAGWVHA